MLHFIESAIILAIVVLGGMGSLTGIAVAAALMIGGTEILRELDFLGRHVKVDFATDEQMERGNKERSDFGGRSGNAPYGKRNSGEGGYKGRSNYGGNRDGGNRDGYGQRRDDNSRGRDDYGKRSFSSHGSYGKKDYGKKDASFGGKSKDGYPRKRY